MLQEWEYKGCRYIVKSKHFKVFVSRKGKGNAQFQQLIRILKDHLNFENKTEVLIVKQNNKQSKALVRRKAENFLTK